jgi:hypothetical protein
MGMWARLGPEESGPIIETIPMQFLSFSFPLSVYILIYLCVGAFETPILCRLDSPKVWGKLTTLVGALRHGMA